MPGPQNVARQELRQIDAVKIARFGPVMGQGAPDHHLGQVQQRNDQKVLHHRLLSGRRRAGPHDRRDHLLPALPPQVVESAHGEQHQGQPRQKHGHAQGAPQNGVAGQPVAHCGVVRKIVGV